MLDPSDPANEKYFRISGCDGAIYWIAKRMTLVDTDARQVLLKEATDPLTEMHRLADEFWPGEQTTHDAIAALQKCLEKLAATPSKNDFLMHWSKKTCTVCNGRIQDPARAPEMVYCPKCLSAMDDGRAAIRSTFFPAELEDSFS